MFLVAILIALLDLPWLLFNMNTFNQIVSDIQGGKLAKFKPAAGIPVYLALAYLVGRASSITDAFLIGAATYAVYDFTVVFAFTDYPISTAVADIIWGGVLLAAAYWMVKKFDL